MILYNAPFLVSALTETVTALFATAGIKTQIFMHHEEWGVRIGVNINLRVGSARARWQIHELPVDFSIDPKLRCRPKHVGRFLYGGRMGWADIHGVALTSLVLHSVVILVDNEPVICGSIVPAALPTSTASIEFSSGVYGRIFILQWPGEHSVHRDTNL